MAEREVESGLPGAEGNRGGGQLSPLSGAYLLIVVGEPASAEHKELIQQRISKGFLSWDLQATGCDLSSELQLIVDQKPTSEEAKTGERLIQYATENLVTEVLINAQVNTLTQCIKNLLSSYTRHKHIIHAGYAFRGSGSWVLQDGTFSYLDFIDALQEAEVQRLFRAYENCVSIHVHCAPEGPWSTANLSRESGTKYAQASLNPIDKGSPLPSVSNFVDYLAGFLKPQPLGEILEPSDVVGNIRFSRPTLYVFPGGQGDSALFGVNGFNMLVDGGFSRRACFWDFVRHLDRVDALLVTRLNNSTVGGVSSLLRRKAMSDVYPQIGHVFCNVSDKKQSPDGHKDQDRLVIDMVDENHKIMENLKQLNMKPQGCFRDPNTEPINLYHKVGHGKLDMYVVNPSRDSREVKEFLHQWNAQSHYKAGMKFSDRELTIPLPNLMSICALLVWQPADPSDSITRILFPGSSPQNKIFEGLEKLKHLDILKQPICTENTLRAPAAPKGKRAFQGADIKATKPPVSKPVSSPKSVDEKPEIKSPLARTERKIIEKKEDKKLESKPSKAEEKREERKSIAKTEDKKETRKTEDKKPERRSVGLASTRKPEVPRTNGVSRASPAKAEVSRPPMRAKGAKDATNKKTVEAKNIATKAATVAAAAKKDILKKPLPSSPSRTKTTTPRPIKKPSPVSSVKSDFEKEEKPPESPALSVGSIPEQDKKDEITLNGHDEIKDNDLQIGQDSAEEEKVSVDEKQSLEEETRAEKEEMMKIVTEELTTKAEIEKTEESAEEDEAPEEPSTKLVTQDKFPSAEQVAKDLEEEFVQHKVEAVEQQPLSEKPSEEPPCEPCERETLTAEIEKEELIVTFIGDETNEQKDEAEISEEVEKDEEKPKDIEAIEKDIDDKKELVKDMKSDQQEMAEEKDVEEESAEPDETEEEKPVAPVKISSAIEAFGADIREALMKTREMMMGGMIPPSPFAQDESQLHVEEKEKSDEKQQHEKSVTDEHEEIIEKPEKLEEVSQPESVQAKEPIKKQEIIEAVVEEEIEMVEEQEELKAKEKVIEPKVTEKDVEVTTEKDVEVTTEKDVKTDEEETVVQLKENVTNLKGEEEEPEQEEKDEIVATDFIEKLAESKEEEKITKEEEEEKITKEEEEEKITKDEEEEAVKLPEKEEVGEPEKKKEGIVEHEEKEKIIEHEEEEVDEPKEKKKVIEPEEEKEKEKDDKIIEQISKDEIAESKSPEPASDENIEETVLPEKKSGLAMADTVPILKVLKSFASDLKEDIHDIKTDLKGEIEAVKEEIISVQKTLEIEAEKADEIMDEKPIKEESKDDEVEIEKPATPDMLKEVVTDIEEKVEEVKEKMEDISQPLLTAATDIANQIGKELSQIGEFLSEAEIKGKRNTQEEEDKIVDSDVDVDVQETHEQELQEKEIQQKESHDKSEIPIADVKDVKVEIIDKSDKAPIKEDAPLKEIVPELKSEKPLERDGSYSAAETLPVSEEVGSKDNADQHEKKPDSVDVKEKEPSLPEEEIVEEQLEKHVLEKSEKKSEEISPLVPPAKEEVKITPDVEHKANEQKYVYHHDYPKTPDEVADLPIDEEAAPVMFSTSPVTTQEPFVQGENNVYDNDVAAHELEAQQQFEDQYIIHDAPHPPDVIHEEQEDEEEKVEQVEDIAATKDLDKAAEVEPAEKAAPVYMTVSADHAEVVTLSEGTSPSTPLSPKSPPEKPEKLEETSPKETEEEKEPMIEPALTLIKTPVGSPTKDAEEKDTSLDKDSSKHAAPLQTEEKKLADEKKTESDGENEEIEDGHVSDGGSQKSQEQQDILNVDDDVKEEVESVTKTDDVTDEKEKDVLDIKADELNQQQTSIQKSSSDERVPSMIEGDTQKTEQDEDDELEEDIFLKLKSRAPVDPMSQSFYGEESVFSEEAAAGNISPTLAQFEKSPRESPTRSGDEKELDYREELGDKLPDVTSVHFDKTHSDDLHRVTSCSALESDTHLKSDTDIDHSSARRSFSDDYSLIDQPADSMSKSFYEEQTKEENIYQTVDGTTQRMDLLGKDSKEEAGYQQPDVQFLGDGKWTQDVSTDDDGSEPEMPHTPGDLSPRISPSDMRKDDTSGSPIEKSRTPSPKQGKHSGQSDVKCIVTQASFEGDADIFTSTPTKSHSPSPDEEIIPEIEQEPEDNEEKKILDASHESVSSATASPAPSPSPVPSPAPSPKPDSPAKELEKSDQDSKADLEEGEGEEEDEKKGSDSGLSTSPPLSAPDLLPSDAQSIIQSIQTELVDKQINGNDSRKDSIASQGAKDAEDVDYCALPSSSFSEQSKDTTSPHKSSSPVPTESTSQILRIGEQIEIDELKDSSDGSKQLDSLLNKLEKHTSNGKNEPTFEDDQHDSEEEFIARFKSSQEVTESRNRRSIDSDDLLDGSDGKEHESLQKIRAEEFTIMGTSPGDKKSELTEIRKQIAHEKLSSSPQKIPVEEFMTITSSQRATGYQYLCEETEKDSNGQGSSEEDDGTASIHSRESEREQIEGEFRVRASPHRHLLEEEASDEDYQSGSPQRIYQIDEGGRNGMKPLVSHGGGQAATWEEESETRQSRVASWDRTFSPNGKTEEDDDYVDQEQAFGTFASSYDTGVYGKSHEFSDKHQAQVRESESSGGSSPHGFEMDSPEIRPTEFDYPRSTTMEERYLPDLKRHEITSSSASSTQLSTPSSESGIVRDEKCKTSIDDWGEPMGLPSPPPPAEHIEKPLENGRTSDRKKSSLHRAGKTNPKMDNKRESAKDKEQSSVTGTPKKHVPAKAPSRDARDLRQKRPESPKPVIGTKKQAASKSPAGPKSSSSGSHFYVDLTYVPHHGNPYYSNVEFFKRVRARYYVFSGINPSKEVLNSLLEAKQTWENKDQEVTIIPTYDTDTLGYWVALNEDMLNKCKIDLAPSASRCTINLQDHETSCSAYRLEF